MPGPCFAWCVPIVDDPEEATLQASIVEKKIEAGTHGTKVLMELPTFSAVAAHIGKKNMPLTRPRFDIDVDNNKKYNKFCAALSKKIVDKKIMPATPAALAVEAPAAQPKSENAPASTKHLLI